MGLGLGAGVGARYAKNGIAQGDLLAGALARGRPGTPVADQTGRMTMSRPLRGPDYLDKPTSHQFMP